MHKRILKNSHCCYYDRSNSIPSRNLDLKVVHSLLNQRSDTISRVAFAFPNKTCYQLPNLFLFQQDQFEK